MNRTVGETGFQPMEKELFGAFGDRHAFERAQPPAAFDRMLEGPEITVGVRTSELGIPGRSSVCKIDQGVCVLWGEVYLPAADGDGHPQAAGEDGRLQEADRDDPARWLLDEYAERGPEALSELNGSFLAVIDPVDRESIVATDAVRSRECYFTDAGDCRVFGTDPAAVARTVPSPEVASEPLLEFVHFGTVLDDRTVLEEVSRVPFDSYLTATDAHELDRFVYDPTESDYAAELAARLRRSLERRADLPGRKGMLLSGGYDSRAILAGVPDMDVAFTIGQPGSSEATVAKKVAAQYGTPHQTLTADERYLNTGPETVRYGHGIMESLHVHHAGFSDQMDVDTIYHGALGDTLLRGYFLPIDGVEVFNHKCPPYRLDSDPDIGQHFAKKFGYMPASERFSRAASRFDESGKEFLDRRIREVLDRWSHRFDSTYDGIALFGIQNQPTRGFRHHLANNFIEACVALDAELIDWHLSTPPEHRNTNTFLRALRKLDSDMLRHRPPDRPYDSYTLNQVDNFLRRKLPFVSSYEGPWPDRGQLYEQNDLDQKLFGSQPTVQDLPWRLKLRINDITTWLDGATGHRPVAPSDFLKPRDGEEQNSDLLQSYG